MDSGFTTAIKQEIALTNLDDQILDRDQATHNKARESSSNPSRPPASQRTDPAMTHASSAEAPNAPRAKPQVHVSDTSPPAKGLHLRGLASLMLFVTWYQRAGFRAELRADLRHKPDYLSDIGICRHEATSEATRFFWEPVLLSRSLAGCERQ